MKILVTGGTGFIGSHTAVELNHAGFVPVLMDNLDNSSLSVLEGLKKILGKEPLFFQEDCNDPEAYDRIFTAVPDIQGIIHFAAHKAVGESVAQPLKYYRNNLGSLVALTEKALEYSIPNLVFSSSCTVYGEPETLPVSEDLPVLPAQSPYGNTKQMGEEILRDTVLSGAKLKALSLRYFNPIGAHPSAAIGELPLGIPGNLVPFVVQTAAGWRQKLSIFGNDYNTPDGTCIRDYIHVVDIARAHVHAVRYLIEKKECPFYDWINLGTGKGSSVLEVVQTFEKVSGIPLNYEIVARRPGDVEKIYASTHKAEEVLGWKTELSLEQGLADAWRWQQKLGRKPTAP
jgi:UDP-glucose 4-epimerase